MDSFRPERQDRYRPKDRKRIPRRIPDELFNALFAGLKYHRDRALLGFWVSAGARAEELLTRCEKGVLPGRRLIARMLSADAFPIEQLAKCQSSSWTWLDPAGFPEGDSSTCARDSVDPALHGAKNRVDPGQDFVQLTSPQSRAVVRVPQQLLAQLHRVVPVLGEDAEHIEDCGVDPIAVVRVSDCQR
ncbi:hypothetical protein [Streptomyces iconiensis]|uniref:Uncharacterized protein n=1 Tax=Streptomyces iconiensis TaxID=1384038 RepID=A0ABT6ZYW1_9ACTN|nr:hypothetical protein [Streptomyces iconiensis]MDJ1134249.1 hypothetical protein [Streptomyces iconiensis]